MKDFDAAKKKNVPSDLFDNGSFFTKVPSKEPLRTNLCRESNFNK